MSVRNLAHQAHASVWAPMNRIAIERVSPELDGGRYPVKRVVGDRMNVEADILRDGHEVLGAAVRFRAVKETAWRMTPMRLQDNDRWRGCIELTENTRYLYTIDAWTDLFRSWCRDFVRKRDAGQDIALEIVEGRRLVEAAKSAASPEDTRQIDQILRDLSDGRAPQWQGELLTSDFVARLMERCGPRDDERTYGRELEVIVDRRAAKTAAWYEIFPRSQGTVAGRSGTFADVIRRLPDIAALGFDVLYMVPIHPIGRINRKGRNNTLTAGPRDPGSPYAIGAKEGGHTAIHPDLGTIEDFRRLVAACRDNGLEVALDFAIQCAPDHPWIAEHPEWFVFRPDGSIKYAENPPKKYQDIVNVNFYGPHREALWQALRDVVLFWVQEGVKTFRVDNPHTKPVPFWEWLIREVQEKHPEVVFLSEAFTRPKVLKLLAKAGFTQSYTYFTWRNFKQELTDYLTELTRSECREYLRPNFFANTPDILPPVLQSGVPAAFQMRLVLAATLSSVYGIYNGFELCEGRALPNSEEYADSEKYELKVWDWDRSGNIKDYIRRVNRARAENPALQDFLNLRFYTSSSDHILFYGKMTADLANIVFIAVNLDPFEAHEAEVEFPLTDMGLGDEDAFACEDLLEGSRHLWRGATQRIRLDPASNPAAIFRITPFRHVDYAEPCF